MGDEHALKNKAIALEHLGRYDAALACYRRIVTGGANDPGAEWNLALFQLGYWPAFGSFFYESERELCVSTSRRQPRPMC